MLAAMLYADSL